MRFSLSHPVISACLVISTGSVGDSASAAPAEALHGELRPTTIFVEPLRAADDSVRKAELHLIAHELLITQLASTKKFNFAQTPQDASVVMVLTGTVSRQQSQYRMHLFMTPRDGVAQEIELAPDASLESLVTAAADAIDQQWKRRGYIIKRAGSRIVIALGSRDGISVGQRYRTTDTNEEFVIEQVSLGTAEGRITARGTRRRARLNNEELGMVDVVFVIDVTASMQEEIDGVLDNVERFVDRLSQSGIDSTLGLVTFRKGITSADGMTNRAQVFKEWLRPIHAAGRANETPFEALERAMTFRFRPSAKRIFVLITDEPAFDAIISACPSIDQWKACLRMGPEEIFATGFSGRVVERLRATETVVFPVAIFDEQGLYQQLALRTHGAFYDIRQNQDFTSLLNTLGEKIEGMFEEL